MLLRAAHTTIIGRRYERSSRIACIRMSAALVYMMLDASTGLLRACECVGRHAFRHDYIEDLPINDVAWFAKTPWRYWLLYDLL